MLKAINDESTLEVQPSVDFEGRIVYGGFHLQLERAYNFATE